MIHEQYSRIPVYEQNIDQVIGFVHVRDMFELEEKSATKRTVRELVRPIPFVPETKPVNDLMRQMQQENTHMVIVVDEYGNTAGLATMEDLLEVIIGEIRDEHEPDSDVTEDGHGGLHRLRQFRSRPRGRPVRVLPPRGGHRIHHRGRPGERVAGARAQGRRVRGARRHSHRSAGLATSCGWSRFASASRKRLLNDGCSMNEHFKSGFVSLIGRPNAGKSTLLNALVGQKLAIVADKPQTTRTSIQGVLTMPEAQIVFLDTPGIHKADSPLNKRLMDAVRAALEERDLLLFVADAARTFGEQDRRALDLVRKTGTPVVLVLNKIDLVKEKARLLPLIDEYRRLYEFADYVPVSAARGAGPRGSAQSHRGSPARRPGLLSRRLRYRPAGAVSGRRADSRESAAGHAPGSAAFGGGDGGPVGGDAAITRIYATIRVERDGQKAIVIGARGAMLKKIGTLARQEMERLFGVKIYLDLHVRVQPGWREKAAFLNALDWRTMTGEDDF